jgi:glycosyltransferase involved in cell wall biosynthesis
MLKGTEGVLRKEFDKLVEWTRDEPPPDVINLPNSLLVALAAPLRDALKRPVCCTLQGEELFLNGLAAPYREQAFALIRQLVPTVDRFIAVSEYCATFMSGLLEIPGDRIDVVPLGISMKGYEQREDEGDAFRVGYFARVAPEKGLHVLADAYVRFRRRVGAARVRLEAAGYLAPAHEAYLREVRDVLEQAGLAHEFHYRGAVNRAGKLAFLRGLDVLSVPATYDEPKGMFLLEAMASGVPVVQPRRGGFIEIVEKTGGGLLVAPPGPGNPDSLADALHLLWSDRAMVRTLSARAFEGVRAHYTIEQSAGRLLDVYQALLKGAPPLRTSVA